MSPSPLQRNICMQVYLATYLARGQWNWTPLGTSSTYLPTQVVMGDEMHIGWIWGSVLSFFCMRLGCDGPFLFVLSYIFISLAAHIIVVFFYFPVSSSEIITDFVWRVSIF